MQKLIQISFDKMKTLLFPFNMKRWFKIFLIVLLAGAAGSSGGLRGASNLNKSKMPHSDKPPFSMATPSAPLVTGEGMSGHSMPLPQSPYQNPAFSKQPVEPPAPAHPMTRSEKIEQTTKAATKKYGVWVVALILLIGLPLVVFASWINARFQFILLDFLAHQNLAIRPSWTRHKILGDSLFKFNIFILLAAIVFAGCAFSLFLLGPVGIAVAILLLITGFLAFIVAILAINDFVVPLMYHQNLQIGPAARLFWEQDFDLGQIALYYLVKIGLGIVAGIAQGILFVLLLIAVGIPTGIIFLLIAGAMKALPALKLIGIILMIAGGVTALAALLSAAGVATLPIHIFFQCLRINFVTRLLSDYRFFEGTAGESSAPST